MIIPALEAGGYNVMTQVKIGARLGRGAHYVDVVAEREGQIFLVSMKWQQVSGTAEQKVPYEVICLIDAMGSGNYTKAYIVLGGEGWSLRTFYTEGGLSKFLVGADRVQIVTLENFVAKANRGLL